MHRIAHLPLAALCILALIPGCARIAHDAGGPAAAPRFVPLEIGFWSLDRGIALDRHGNVALTTDGGRRWRVVGSWGPPRSGYGPRSLSVSRQGSAAFLTRCGRIGCGELVRTLDGGRSWSTFATRGVDPTAVVVARTQPQVAWALVDYGAGPSVRLARSSDGGRTWMPVKSPCRAGWSGLNPISLATRRRGWEMCGSQPAAGEQPKQLLVTRDAGRSFSSLLHIDPFRHGGRPGGLSISGYTVALSMTADGHGLLAEERAPSYRTADGGRNWLPIEHVTQPDYRDAFAAFQLSPRVGYLLVYGAGRTDLYRSTDGDRRWRRLAHWRGP